MGKRAVLIHRSAAATLILASAGMLGVPMATMASGSECSDIQHTAGGCGTGGLAEHDVWLEYREDGPYVDDYYLDGEPSGTPCHVWDMNGCTFYVTTIDQPSGQPISMSDIARFRPSTPVGSMEPNGWAVIGLDTNFFATGEAEVVEGSLLGHPASVRFTPVAWRWTYGDGTSATVSVPGGSWSSLGIPEFDPTPTSHVFRQAGTYAVDLTVEYRAEYRFGSLGWTRIAGVLAVAGNQLQATVGDAKTVLVSGDCTAKPRGSGC